jgi:hypothetical protein
MQDDFFLESIYRRFDAAIDRIDSRQSSPTPREAGVLTQVLDQIKAENFERASELPNALNQAIVASSPVTNGDGASGRSHHDTGTSQQNERDPDPSDIARRRPSHETFSARGPLRLGGWQRRKIVALYVFGSRASGNRPS